MGSPSPSMILRPVALTNSVYLHFMRFAYPSGTSLHPIHLFGVRPALHYLSEKKPPAQTISNQFRFIDNNFRPFLISLHAKKLRAFQPNLRSNNSAR